MDAAVAGAPLRQRVMVARVLLAADEPDLALALVDRQRSNAAAPPGRVTSRTKATALRVAGRALGRLGQLSAASERFSAAVATAPGQAGARRDLTRLAGELRSLNPAWHPSRPAGARSRAAPVRGRVLHLLTNSLPYKQAGYTVRSHRIALAQRAVGLDPHVVTRAGFPALQGFLGAPAFEAIDGVPYHRLVANDLALVGQDRAIERNLELLAGVAERLRPAVLHPTSNHLNGQVALALREARGIPVVYEVRGFLEETWLSRRGPEAVATQRYRLTRAAETRCMQEADRVVTLSEGMRREIAERGVPPERVLVVPNAVDPDRFQPGPADQGLRARLGIESGEVVVGYVSSLTEYEGVRYLLEATALLRARGRRVRALIVGDGDERSALEEHARSVGLAGHAIFTGRVPQDAVMRYYRVIDVFVVPRTGARVCHLVSPLKPVEAMAMERPVVVSATTALRELVTPGETGETFVPEDAGDLADTLEPLIEDPSRRARLGRSARQWVIEHRTWRQNAQRYRRLYQEVDAV